MFMALTFLSAAQDVWMHPNEGQWDSRVEYKVDLALGELLIEKDGFTFNLTDAKQKLGHNHEDGHEDHHHDEKFLSHVIKSKFIGSSWGGEVVESEKSSFYRNYFIGNDQSKWKTDLFSYRHLRFKEFYQGIDLVLEGKSAAFKYSLEVAPGVSPELIKMHYDGQSRLYIDEDGNLHIVNRFGEIIEEKPVAWLEESGRKVPVNFVLKENDVSFEFPDGYDQSKKLIIDPSLTFSTFSGSQLDNWGMTATPGGDDGSLIGGGVVFGQPGFNYPITTGAYDGTYNGGQLDIGLTKFTSDGTSLIFSTYIGGGASETVQSIIAGDNGDVYLFGVTSSLNFPMAGTPYDNTFSGGSDITENFLNFENGTDLYVARLSGAGNALIASTYVGGSGNDGLNSSSLTYNYGDEFRGEITLDENGFVYVASVTPSTNFPVQQGSQGSLGGGQDAVVFKMPPSLNTLMWSTYYGGSGDETGNSVQVSSSGNVYMTGGTTSSNISLGTGHDLSYGGGRDAYVTRFNGNNGTVMSGTYIGLDEYDQGYFVQLDIDDNVYVLGQSESNLGVTTPYGIANSGQFIHQFNEALTTLNWKTMIGAGSGTVEMSPTAFLVSNCYDIYLSGWASDLNANLAQASGSTVLGFPTTPGAWQTATTGNNFYIAVLDGDAAFLKYGTFFGGTNNLSDHHVDGGTSRFDKTGRIYHAVCGSCGPGVNNGFTTTPSAWSTVSGSSNCNLAAFKFELSTIEAVVSNPDPIVCLPDPVIFNNNSANGNAFFWDFGDNTTSTDVNPIHLYPGPGTYTVTLIVTDTNECYSPDTTEFVINIGDFNAGAVQPAAPICPGDSIQLEAYGGAFFEWSPAQFLDDPTSATPIAVLDETTDFMVVVSDSCGIDTAYVTVVVFDGMTNISNDTSICIGNSVQLFAGGGVDYEWTPATYLDDPTSPTPISTPDADIQYNVVVTTADGCILEDSVYVDVYYTPPVPVIPDILQVCEGGSVEVTVSGGETYLWYPDLNISAIDTNVVTITPAGDLYYYCDFTNPCGTVTDSVFIDVVTASITAGTDTVICPGETATLWAQGGVSYVWSPSGTLNNSTSSQVLATPTAPTMYYVVGTDKFGCTASDSVWVDLFPLPFIQTSPDVYALYGDEVQLSATSTTTGPYIWSPAEYLSCVSCPSPVANPNQNYTYIVTYTDENGCSASDEVNIYYDPIIYVPNTFTPGSDEYNNVFQVVGGNVRTFEMEIFNRWGELIHTMNSIDESWDGTYDGNQCQDGTYVWKLKVTDFEDEEHYYTGHVNLLR